MKAHLDEISTYVENSSYSVVIIDGAGQHTTKSLAEPSNISLLRLPPYSPELNPQENIWQFMRQNKLANRCYENYDAIVDACCEAWNDLIARQKPSNPPSAANGCNMVVDRSVGVRWEHSALWCIMPAGN
jgi:hypothetical protein